MEDTHKKLIDAGILFELPKDRKEYTIYLIRSQEELDQIKAYALDRGYIFKGGIKELKYSDINPYYENLIMHLEPTMQCLDRVDMNCINTTPFSYGYETIAIREWKTVYKNMKS